MEEPKTHQTEVEQMKMKKERTTKKSRAVEFVKQKQIIDVLLRDASLPSYLKEILKNEDTEKGQLPKLSKEEVEKLWGKLEVFVRENVSEIDMVQVAEERGEVSDKEGQERRIELVGALAGLILHTAKLHSPEHNDDFVEMAVALNLAVMREQIADNKIVHNQICELCEFCCSKALRLPGEFFLNTVKIRLDNTLNAKEENDMRAETKRLWELRVALPRMKLQAAGCEVIVNQLTRIIVNPHVLACKDGRQFIGYTLTLDTKLTKKFNETIKQFLPSCKKSQANLYGEVYHSAWITGSSEIRGVVENCIQNYMTHVLTNRRKGQDMSPLGQTLFALLSHLHSHRTNAHFSKKLTELYMPLIWRHLRSGCNVERANAAEVLMDVYPLEQPGTGRVVETDLMLKQHAEMGDLITDNCHTIRIIAVLGVCENMLKSWETFSQESIQVLMRKMLSLANDGSSGLVRRALYQGLTIMLHNPRCVSYVSRILPSLAEYIHDENVKVRTSFVKMLLAVKALPSPALKYYKIVSFEHLAARLEHDGKEVGTQLSRLLLSNIYTPELTTDKILFKLLQFAEVNPVAVRKLFLYSKQILSYKDAVRVMLIILLNLRNFVKVHVSNMSESDDDQENKPLEENAPVVKKKKKTSKALQPIDENHERSPVTDEKQKQRVSDESCSSVAESSVSSSAASVEGHIYNKPCVVHALVDIVSLLWSMHGTCLMDPVNEEDYTSVISVASAAIPICLKFYKGTPVYQAVVHLATLVPASKLLPVSTVISACISQLKNFSEVGSDIELQLLVTALCAWNRFSDIQDIVTDWLDQAFRCEGLNLSQAPAEQKRQRKVRFVAKGGKPMLALRVLDTLFDHVISHKRVVDKSYANVLELYNYMERIKILVERRLLLGLPLESPMLSDQFLLKCTYRYTRLMIILHKPEESFNASDVFAEFLDWTINFVKPHIEVDESEEEENFSIVLVRDILRSAANLIDVMYATDKSIVKLAEFMLNLLSSDYNLWFVEPCLILTKHIKDYTAAVHGPKNSDLLLKKVVPSLLSRVLFTLSQAKYTQEEVLQCVKNLPEVKTVMYEVLQSIRDLGPNNPLLPKVLKLFTDAIVATIVHEVKSIQLLDPVDKVQNLPFVCGLLFSIVMRPRISAVWLSTVPSSITELYAGDGNVLGAAVALLHTLVRGNLRLPTEQLIDCIQAAHSAVSAYGRQSVSHNHSYSLLDTTIDVKGLAAPILKDLASFLHCPLKQTFAEPNSP